jgi:hypothetical protein
MFINSSILFIFKLECRDNKNFQLIELKECSALVNNSKFINTKGFLQFHNQLIKGSVIHAIETNLYL